MLNEREWPYPSRNTNLPASIADSDLPNAYKVTPIRAQNACSGAVMRAQDGSYALRAAGALQLTKSALLQGKRWSASRIGVRRVRPNGVPQCSAIELLDRVSLGLRY